ncbi:esterase-like activity of phytase family protein [Mesorhizobium sp. VNQ89]|uniref:esterase-like activity of phytase family protein n=1 Tax=Mesorhizobium quangtriensis TaxID=3157709 RepID=UPI0032B806CF
MSVALRRGAFYFGFAVIAVGCAFAFTSRQPVRAAADAIEQIEVSARPISNFRIGSSETRFGPLEFVGGLEMTSPSRDFGGLSSFRFLKPGSDFIGVSDSGFWFFGSVARDAEGKPTGFDNFRMQQMYDRAGKLSGKKWQVDAESLAVKDGVATVGFERDHRISQFRVEPEGMKPAFKDLNFLIPKRELRENRGFETIAYAHPYGQHEGGLVAVTEKSLDKDGNIFAAIIEGPNKGIFSIRRNGEFDITDGAFLPNGDLLLLERSFSMATGVRMRLRRIYGESITKGAVADGPVLFEADMLHQIDNMEGMDVWTREDGAQMVSLISDDNHSLIQRNLYLEFVLHDEAEPQASSTP